MQVSCPCKLTERRKAMFPRISLITPSFQQAPFLEECLTSVLDQGYPDLEYLVVDGGSTDGSKRIIERFAHRLTWWCSEPDQGQAHAINKGAARSTGEVFGWLNSDDVLLPGALLRVGNAFAEDPSLMIFEGARIMQDRDGERTLQPPDDPTDEQALFSAPRINQQSTFYRSSVVHDLGGVDASLHYVMDVELWWQLLFRHGTSGLHTTSEPLALFRIHGASKTDTAQEKFVEETAGLLHGLCISTGLEELAGILALGHRFKPLARPFRVGSAQRGIVEHMTVSFLLKWNRTVHTRNRFEALRRFVASSHADPSRLNAEQRERVRLIGDQLDVPGWWAFRARRKWQHLFG